MCYDGGALVSDYISSLTLSSYSNMHVYIYFCMLKQLLYMYMGTDLCILCICVRTELDCTRLYRNGLYCTGLDECQNVCI